ncbi:hypothetical protein [Methylomonas sp. MgM2]
MKISKLAQAIAITLSGSALVGVSTANASTTSYNTFNHDRPAPHTLVSGGSDGNGTDGWMRTAANGCGGAGSSCGDGPLYSNGYNPAFSYPAGNAEVPWVGNDPRTDPNFNYSGVQVLHWTAVIGAGETAEISRLDSNKWYANTVLADGTTFNYADIDTAQGAWHDNVNNGWRHDTDIGLFRSTVTQTVTLSIASLLSNGQTDETPDYGFTVFEGMDTTDIATHTYLHHGSWHGGDPGFVQAVGDNAFRLTPNNPFTGGSGLENFILDDVNGNSATFTAEAGKIYTIFLGGFQAGDWTITRNDYQLMISGAPVPVPGAVWLFGSALAGFIGIQRRKHIKA